MNEVMQQLAAVAQQYMQSQSPEAAMQLIQMAAQSQDPQLLMMVADSIAATVSQGAGDPAAAGGDPAAQGGAPMGQNGMQVPTMGGGGQQPMYANGGKLTAIGKMKAKRAAKHGASHKPNTIAAK
jgi:hypothetical protein